MTSPAWTPPSRCHCSQRSGTSVGSVVPSSSSPISASTRGSSQSGGRAATHGRITKSRTRARAWDAVEAAFTASKIPGPLRAFYQRVRARRGTQIAIVATARKLVCLCWTMIERGEDYAFARQSLTEKKLRALELRAGLPARSPRSRTRCSSRPGTSSPPARSTATRAATTSRAATPNARPDGSSPTSRSSDTSSHSNRQRQRHPAPSLPERGFLFSS